MREEGVYPLFACAFGSHESVPHGMFPGNCSGCFFGACQVLHHLAGGVEGLCVGLGESDRAKNNRLGGALANIFFYLLHAVNFGCSSIMLFFLGCDY